MSVSQSSPKYIRHTQELHPRSISPLRLVRHLRSPPKPLKWLKLQFNLALKRLRSTIVSRESETGREVQNL